MPQSEAEKMLIARLKDIIGDYENEELTLAELDKLQEALDEEIVHEKIQRKLFKVVRDDPRENMRLQFNVLKKALAVDKIEIDEANPRPGGDIMDGTIRWDLYRHGDPTDRAVLKLTKDNLWLVGISYPKKSDLCHMSLTRLLQRHEIDPCSLGGWNVGG